MEQTALRPKPMPGQGPTDKDPADGGARRPHAAPRRRGRRLANLAGAVLAALVLVLAGVGLGTLGSTVIGMRELAALQHRSAPAPTAPAPATASPPPATTGATLGVEAVDTRGPGALVVAVHVPGPGYTAGLVRGDVVLALGRSRVDDAASLARAVSRARPGHGITLTVRHTNGTRQHLTAIPGITT
ncbi:PDZ domain-containing protein [Streptomyces sp. NPDC057412]|uniref:PDZ domain-containing protein n=1 Tax=Streptomyces sp. NPDC057412 TaxID=3346123 RepID=UPI0036C16407